MSTDWPKLVNDLQTESGASQRQMASQAGINRSTLRRFQEKKTTLTLEKLERLLSLFGYELDIFKTGEPHIKTSIHDHRQPSRRGEPKQAAKKKLIIIRSMQRGAV